MNTKYDHVSENRTDHSDAHFNAALAWFTALSVSIAAFALS